MTFLLLVLGLGLFLLGLVALVAAAASAAPCTGGPACPPAHFEPLFFPPVSIPILLVGLALIVGGVVVRRAGSPRGPAAAGLALVAAGLAVIIFGWYGLSSFFCSSGGGCSSAELSAVYGPYGIVFWSGAAPVALGATTLVLSYATARRKRSLRTPPSGA